MRHNYTTSRIRQFIYKLALGQMFSTRDCLNLGPRTSVDKALSRMVKQEFLVRLTNGMFTRMEFDTVLPEASAIAQYKAKAFFRPTAHIPKSFTRAEMLLAEIPSGEGASINPRDQSQRKAPFATVGATTRFRLTETGEYQALLRRSPRKIVLGDKLHGLVIRSLWNQGVKGKVSAECIAQALSHLGRAERKALRESCHIMPAWLADQIIWPFIFPREAPKQGAAP